MPIDKAISEVKQREESKEILDENFLEKNEVINYNENESTFTTFLI